MTDERYLPDIDNLRTVEDVISWLREAAKTCAETARHNRDLPDHAIYLRGRAEAFGLAARPAQSNTELSDLVQALNRIASELHGLNRQPKPPAPVRLGVPG